MEKIKVNNQALDLIPMGINIGEKSMSVTVSSILKTAEIETIFTEFPNIQHLSETDEVLTTYTDCVSVKSISHDIANGTYTVVISTDVIARSLKKQAEVTEMLVSAIDYILTDGLIYEGEKAK